MTPDSPHPEPQAATFGPMVHRFGHRRPDEWDIPFYDWTILRAIDAEGREHIFEVPTRALPPSEPLHPIARFIRDVRRVLRG